MRKLATLLTGASLVLVLSLFFTGFTLAEDSSTSNVSPKPIFRREEIKDSIKEMRSENEASREARFCELRKRTIKAYFERMLERLSALIERLQKLIDRIQARIEKIEAAGGGIDLTGPKADLASAKTKLADAKAKLELLKPDINTFLTCEDPKESFKTVRGKVEEIKKELQEVHRLLVKIIGNIKGLRVGDTEHSPKPTPTE